MSSRFGRCLNINVGVLGHVDSGKTSLVEKLSTVFSTASLDKHPQSQERGITLDLGFSSFQVPYPDHLANLGNCSTLQFTLVDCPGHASLIRTVLGGSHIMDAAILVVDITKGVQIQTAECIVIAEITVKNMIVVLNKTDLLPAEKSQKMIEKAIKKVSKMLKLTTFNGCPILPISATLGEGMESLVHELTAMITQPPERKTGPLIFAIDHCFRIKGQGTVLTGTVLQGTLGVREMIEFPELKQTRTVKSIQMFREPVQSISAGDRAGICVSNLDPKRIERSLASTPNSIHTSKAALALIEKVRFFDNFVRSRQRFHVLYGHSMTLATCLFLTQASDEEFEFQEELTMDSEQPQLTLLKFDTPLTAPMGLDLIGAKLDGGSDVLSCRLAFHGKISRFLQNQEDIEKIKIFRMKEKVGWIRDLQEDGQTAVCFGMFKQETDLSFYKEKEVYSKTGIRGKIKGPFGKKGDFLVSFEHPILPKSEMEITLFIKKYIS